MRKEVTGRQRQVLQMIADGKYLKQVAHELSITDATVKQHVRVAKRNFEVNSTPAAVGKLLRRGDIK